MEHAATEVVFNPHVAAAIGCIFLALIAAALAFVLGLADRQPRQKE